jgi:MFS family permease
VVATTTTTARAAKLAVLVAALGYFVDIYDLILFNNVRVPSLTALGVPESEQLDKFNELLSTQMLGMLVGGIVWGVLGDKRGRLSVLFGSITLYSIANIANGMVHSTSTYAIWRFVAGLGLAGELGAGVTLVSELMGKESRGVGTTIVAAVGVSGGLLAGLVGGAFGVPHPDWRVAYFIGGGLGFVLLVLRIGVVESGMFHAVAKNDKVARGNFLALFATRKRLARYVAIILVGIPIWYVIAIPVAASQEIGGALGLSPQPNVATSLFFCYGGCSLGGLASGLLSQRVRSRKKSLATFVGLVALALVAYFTLGGMSNAVMYALCGFAGFATGYWAVFVSTAAELFGTNLRATVTTTVPNFVRGSVPLLAMTFKGLSHSIGIVTAAIAVGAGTLVLAVVGLLSLPETFGVDLDFHEEG